MITLIFCLCLQSFVNENYGSASSLNRLRYWLRNKEKCLSLSQDSLSRKAHHEGHHTDLERMLHEILRKKIMRVVDIFFSSLPQECYVALLHRLLVDLNHHLAGQSNLLGRSSPDTNSVPSAATKCSRIWHFMAFFALAAVSGDAAGCSEYMDRRTRRRFQRRGSIRRD